MILVGGGSRSGKSTMALRMLKASGTRRGFIATAQAWDDEMRERIAMHQAERDESIVTWEDPFAVAERIEAEDGNYDAIVVDCLTLWLSNMLLAEDRNVEHECRKLVDVAAGARTKVILVTNEVGCGIVPENALARRFRDYAGRLNQRAAEQAAEVHWMIFGIGLRIKG
jgi:adenosylcobinamide kinase/adenosylcobinamide-phosphate guanylyltransferase